MTLWSQGKENLLVLLVGVTLEVSQKLEIDLTYDSTWTTPRHISYNRHTCTSVFIDTLLTKARKWNQLNCSLTEERTLKMGCTVEYDSVEKKRSRSDNLQVNGWNWKTYRVRSLGPGKTHGMYFPIKQPSFESFVLCI